MSVTERDQLAAAVDEALSFHGPSLVDITTDPELI